MAFFGELYLRSTRPLISEETTRREVDYLARALGAVGPGPVADLGCGHGRHAAPLHAAGPLAGRVLGIELDPLSLAERLPGFPAVRGDLRALPLRDGALAGAWAWYSTLFVFDDAENARVVREVARVLRPGGRLVLHTVPFERLAAQPEARFEQVLPDGSRVEEASRFDPATGRDQGRRTLRLPNGRVLSAEWFVRYYPLAELTELLDSAGFSTRWVHGGLQGEPLSSGATDLILGVERRRG